tara:strand:+ start:269 stop:562 length:294 start_codon:yes stop_codon:yes gene_type:complete
LSFCDFFVAVKLFKSTGIESDMLTEVIAICSTVFTHNKLLLLCDGLSKTSRFSTALMFLETQEMEELQSCLSKMMKDPTIQEKFPKRYQRVMKAYGM